MTVHKFPKVKATRKSKGRCPKCGASSTRSRTFWATVNPFNTNDDGTQKTWTQVNADVEAQAAEWVPDFTCTSPCTP